MQPSAVASSSQNSWTDREVARWAGISSAAANLLETERAAVWGAIDRDDRAQCAQAAMVQTFTRDLACHERQRSTSLALTTFHQLIGLQRQHALLVDATTTLEQLLRFADKATELDIKDGDRFELDKRRLRVADQQAETSGGIIKLQIALSHLVGKTFDETRLATYVHSSTATNDPLVLADQFAIARANRCDLKGIESLCRSLTTDTLPMARQWLTALQPGLGVAIALAARKPILAALHSSDDRSIAELCKRREQCTQLRDERQRQIESEVHVAFVEHQTAITRQEIAQEQLRLTSTAMDQVLTAIELEQASPGADLLAKLEQLESQGRLIDREVAVAVARVKLDETIGVIATDTH